MNLVNMVNFFDYLLGYRECTICGQKDKKSNLFYDLDRSVANGYSDWYHVPLDSPLVSPSKTRKECRREAMDGNASVEIEKILESILNSPLSKRIFYKTENGEEVDLSKLNPGWISDDKFKIGHENFVFGCHDVMLEYNGGLLLVVRDNFPAKDVLWPIGGMYKKGVDTEKSLVKKVKEECNLEIEGKLIYLGNGRTAFQTDPWGHGHGTDTTNERYFAHAKGELKLNELHKNPVIVKPKDYTPEFRRGLEEYVRDFMDLSMLFVKGMDPILLNSYIKESLLKN